MSEWKPGDEALVIEPRHEHFGRKVHLGRLLLSGSAPIWAYSIEAGGPEQKEGVAQAAIERPSAWKAGDPAVIDDPHHIFHGARVYLGDLRNWATSRNPYWAYAIEQGGTTGRVIEESSLRRPTAAVPGIDWSSHQAKLQAGIDADREKARKWKAGDRAVIHAENDILKDNGKIVELIEPGGAFDDEWSCVVVGRGTNRIYLQEHEFRRLPDPAPTIPDETIMSGVLAGVGRWKRVDTWGRSASIHLRGHTITVYAVVGTDGPRIAVFCGSMGADAAAEALEELIAEPVGTEVKLGGFPLFEEPKGDG